jgi:hypothetical protein
MQQACHDKSSGFRDFNGLVGAEVRQQKGWLCSRDCFDVLKQDEGLGVGTTSFNFWEAQYSSKMSNVLTFAVNDNDIFARTDNWGIWRRPLSEMLPVLPQNQHSTPLGIRLCAQHADVGNRDRLEVGRLGNPELLLVFSSRDILCEWEILAIKSIVISKS